MKARKYSTTLLLPEDDPHRQAIVIANPLGEDFSIMRTLSLNGMLTSLGTNYKRRNKNVRLYELGNIYIPKALPLTELPDERMIFTLGMYGEGDFYTMKGVVEEFLDKIGMRSKEDYDPNSGKTYLHPGRQANIGLRRNCDRLSGRGASYSSCFLWNRRPGVCGCSGYAFYHEICYLRQKIRRNRKIPG